MAVPAQHGLEAGAAAGAARAQGRRQRLPASHPHQHPARRQLPRHAGGLLIGPGDGIRSGLSAFPLCSFGHEVLSVRQAFLGSAESREGAADAGRPGDAALPSRHHPVLAAVCCYDRDPFPCATHHSQSACSGKLSCSHLHIPLLFTHAQKASLLRAALARRQDVCAFWAHGLHCAPNVSDDVLV